MVEDIKMNAFQEVEDYEYIYVELADGSQAKIKKSVLANLIRTEIKESFLQNNTEIIDDCNSLGTYENNGLYWINEDTKNAPPLTDYKLAFLFKLTSPGFYYQLCVEPYTNNRWYRWFSNYWSDWKKRQNHICPLQLDIVERLIERYSNKGELVFDPFGGIGTVPYCAVNLGRKGLSTELNYDYWKDSLSYLYEAEMEVSAPTLFDLLDDAV